MQNYLIYDALLTVGNPLKNFKTEIGFFFALLLKNGASYVWPSTTPNFALSFLKKTFL